MVGAPVQDAEQASATWLNEGTVPPIEPASGNVYDLTSARTTPREFVATETGGAGAVGDGVSKPSGVPDFVDPSKSPGAGWEWRGKGEPGSGKGSWYNPGTGESLHPDLNHPVGGTVEGPHYNWKDAAGNNHRVYPGGKIVKK